MIIAIAGATGLTGSSTLQLLLKHPQVTQVISIGRKRTGVQHEKLREVLLFDGQLAEPTVADAFVCCLGTTIKKAGSKAAFEAVDLALPLYLAQALLGQGCRKMAVISSMGADPESSVFYNRTKGKMEQLMKALPLDSLGLFRPSIIDGQRAESRPMEKVGLGFMSIINPLLAGKWRHYRVISADTIAKGLIYFLIQNISGTHIYLSDHIKQLAK